MKVYNYGNDYANRMSEEKEEAVRDAKTENQPVGEGTVQEDTKTQEGAQEAVAEEKVEASEGANETEGHAKKGKTKGKKTK